MCKESVRRDVSIAEVFQVSNGTAYFTSFEMLSISWNSNRSAVEPSGNRMVYSLNVVRKGVWFETNNNACMAGIQVSKLRNYYDVFIDFESLHEEALARKCIRAAIDPTNSSRSYEGSHLSCHGLS